MPLRVIGAHNLETSHTRHTCFLLDDVLGIDAGSLASALSHQEQRQVQAVLITHAHLDHCRDIPALGLATVGAPHPIEVYALPETLAAIQSHLMDGSFYPDLSQSLNGDAPRLRLHPIQPGEPFCTAGFTVEALPASHPVPALGYIVRKAGNRTIGYTGDSTGDLLPFLQRDASPDVLFVDVTFPDRLGARAEASGHLTPAALGQRLARAQSLGLKLPRVIPIHLDIQHAPEVMRELAEVGAHFGLDLSPAYEGMTLDEGGLV